MSPTGRPSQPVSHWDDLTVGQRFAVLWDALTDVLGTAATATLLRRAVKQASTYASLDGLRIERQGFSYGYTLPERWQAACCGPPVVALTAVIDELRPLLVELTGSVLIRRLERLGVFSPLGTGRPAGGSVEEIHP